jgi:hypothetical protein
MRKLFLFFGLAFTTISTASSQEVSKNAIGIRLGNNSGFGYEISYQSQIGYNNRLEIDLGLRSKSGVDSIKATGIFQWVWSLQNRFNGYAGLGGGIGNFRGSGTPKTFLFVTGNIGFEYNFEAPFLISLDYRPEYGFYNVYKGLNSDIALSLRYQF